jgi:hypothetical protein
LEIGLLLASNSEGLAAWLGEEADALKALLKPSSSEGMIG